LTIAGGLLRQFTERDALFPNEQDRGKSVGFWAPVGISTDSWCGARTRRILTPRREFRHLIRHGTVKRDSQEKIPRGVVSEIHCNSTAVKRTDGTSAVLWGFQGSPSTFDHTIRCQGFAHIAPAPVPIWRSARRAGFSPCLIHRLFSIRSMTILFLLPALSFLACSRRSYTGSG
jgi:hypothetical protein